ncbi:MAG TPA: hypothetical protein VI957_01405 [Candidatus Paceibacterota bacterium]
MKNFKYSFLLWFALSAATLVSLLSAYLYLSHNEARSSAQKQSSENQQVPQFEPRLLWSQATSSAEWQPRDSAVSFVFQNKMWTMGGLNGDKEVATNHTVRYWEAPHFNDIWATEDGMHWEMMKDTAEWPPRRSMSVVSFRDKLWMFGGWSPITGYTSDVWQSDDGIVWTQVISEAQFPAREGQTAETFQGKIWLFGGVNYDKHEVKNDVWYSDDGLLWHQATTTIPWSPRWDHATAVFNGKIFLAGGMNLSDQIFKDVWSSSDGFNWKPVTTSAPWQERQGHSLVVFHDTLWIIGRLNDFEGGGANDVWYSDDGITWQKTNTDPSWLGREDHSVLIFNNRIYVFGGMDSNWQWRNDVWFSSN